MVKKKDKVELLYLLFYYYQEDNNNMKSGNGLIPKKKFKYQTKLVSGYYLNAISL